MAVLSRIANVINESKSNWIDIAKKIGFENIPIEQIQKEDDSSKHFVDSLTTRLWEDIFEHCNIDFQPVENIHLPGIIKLAEILSKKRKIVDESNNDSETPFESHDIDVMHEISERLADWKAFLRVFEFPESYIMDFEKNIQKSFTGANIFERNSKRNIYLMKEVLENLNKKEVKTDSKSWMFWRNYLQKFQKGIEVIEEMERYFPRLIAESSAVFVHHTILSNMLFIGHPLQRKSIQIDKTNVEIPVNIGSKTTRMIHFQDIAEWLETKERYMDVFNLFKDKIVFNFHDLKENCPILNTLKQLIKYTGGNGFAVKGYHLIDHLKIFSQQVFINDDKYENYFCFLGNNNIVLNFTKCDKEPGHGLHYASQNIQIMNALHEELQSKDIIQINVLVHNDDESLDFCMGCIENNLYIEEDTLKDIEEFKLWFSKLQKVINELHKKMNIPQSSTNVLALENIKKDMITHEALLNTDFFPSFSNLPEDQMVEMPKIIMLTGVQFEIIHTNNPFIFVRGSYGSGKTFVLLSKLDKCIQLMNEKDIFYYICHDQQSKLVHCMNLVKRNNPNKHIIICNSSSFLLGKKQKLSLSFILNHILEMWKDKTVHVFIDEFSGSYINKGEVVELQKILPKFSKSNIVIALQSMEEKVHEDVTDEIDLGYQYDLLQKNTPFVVYNLDYSLRCSVEINDFVKASTEFIEQREVSIKRRVTFYDDDRNIVVDSEYGQETTFDEKDHSGIQTTLSYNTSKQYGHNSCGGLVSIYNYDKFKARKQSLFKSSDIVPPPVVPFYITTLEYVLNNSDGEKIVICTYNEKLYNSIYYYLQYQQPHTWTNAIEKFIEVSSKYIILLADYASVRGYEFPSFIFMLRMGTKYLKYRMIECFTRATNKLHIITDNINVSDKSSSDNKLIEIWKKLSCVEYFDCKYEQSNDTLHVLQDKIAKYYTKTELSKIFVGSSKRFPWSQPERIQEGHVKEKYAGDNLYWTLRYLCANDNVDVLHEFIEIHQLDVVNYRGGVDESLLHVCSLAGGFNIIQYLLSQYQFDINVRNEDQWSPLHYASLNGYVDIVRYLIDNNADVNMKTNDGCSPLHLASWHGHVDIVRYHINNNADVNMKDDVGCSPLLYASWYDHIDIVRYLIDNNADINMKANDGNTSLDLARHMNNHEIIELLEQQISQEK